MMEYILDQIPKKFILDASCSGRMFWFDKKHPNALYVDNRQIQKGTIKSSPNFGIEPDYVMDFRKLRFQDKSFKLVVWDPPHQKNLDLNSWIGAKYGVLPKDWKPFILDGFNECYRVLEDYGILIFKWSKSHDKRGPKRDITLAELIKILPIRPLFGHPSGSKMNTIWMCFMKIPEEKC